MSIAQLRALILLGNLAAAAGLCVVGGAALWGLVLPPPSAKVVDIPKPNVDVKRRQQKPDRKTFAAIWSTPVVPSMQPSEKPVATATPTGPSNFSVEQAQNLLKQSFALRLTHPNWERPEHSWASLLLKAGGAGGGTGEEVLVQPDDRLSAEVRVMGVHNDYVLFQVRDVLNAKLGFEDLGGTWEQATASAGADMGPSPAAFSASGDRRATGDEPFVARAKKVSAVLWHVSADESRFVAESYNRILREVGVAPHRGADGKIDGIELTEVAESSLVAKRGFQQADVIKSVNGEAVNDPRTLPEVLARQKGKDTIVVVYSRRGVDETVTYMVK